jgi:hypothetical protein
VGCLFDQFVGAAAQRQGHVEAQEIGRLHVDDQLDFGCLQHRREPYDAQLSRAGSRIHPCLATALRAPHQEIATSPTRIQLSRIQR